MSDQGTENRASMAQDAPGSGDCNEALHELYTFLDGELTDDKRRLIRHHLDACNPCLGAFDFEAELRMVIAHRCRDEVPDSLRSRIADAIGDEPGGAPN